jgi:hypothetical protein
MELVSTSSPSLVLALPPCGYCLEAAVGVLMAEVVSGRLLPIPYAGADPSLVPCARFTGGRFLPLREGKGKSTSSRRTHPELDLIDFGALGCSAVNARGLFRPSRWD